jgi:thiaminase
LYIEAWNYVHKLLQEHPADYFVVKSPRAAIARFSTNWVSSEYLDMLASLVNQLDVKPGTDLWRRVEGIWMRVIELEYGFWPTDGEEDSMKKN